MKHLFTFPILLFTFSLFAQAPAGYYSAAEGLDGAALKQALHNIIDNHTEFPYSSSSTDTWDILKEADRDPANPDNVLGIYSAFSMDGAAEYNNGNGWNREHVWPQSRGDLGTSPGPGTDVHHLRASDISTNAARANRNFDEATIQYIDNQGTYSGTTNSYTSNSQYVWEPRAEVKGDVARMIFYMAVRYEGDSGEPNLEITEEYQSETNNAPLIGKLSALLQWHQEDPVDAEEERRNNVIYSYQRNRNPFIDHPEYVGRIWGGETVTSVNELVQKKVNIFPNPVYSNVEVVIDQDVEAFLYNAKGLLVTKCSKDCAEVLGEQILRLEKGLFILLINDQESSEYLKILKR